MSPPGRHGAHAAGAVILAWISAASATSARAAALSGATATKGSPRSAAAASAGSKGTRPRRGMPASRASSAASGPDKSPAMFSTRPRTGAFTWRATVMAFLTTRCETSDGIVTTTVPARRSTSAAIVRSRSVPGGRSSSSRSSSPQLVSVRNSRSALASIEPRQVWASSWVTAFHWRGAESDGSSRSMDITLTPSDVRGGSTPPDARTRRWPRTPSIFAIVGPLRSASRTPTRRPACARQQARFAVSDDLPTPPLPDTIATTARTVARRALSLRCWASTWATMFEPPSPAMSLYFFMRRLADGARRRRDRRDAGARGVVLRRRRMKKYKDIAGDGGSNIVAQVEAQQRRLRARLATVRAVVAIVSGKGGVGKSSLTANLACCLAQAGLRVGVLDADLNGPTMAKMLGVRGQRLVLASGGVEPPRTSLGVKVMSMDLLLPSDSDRKSTRLNSSHGYISYAVFCLK